MQKDVREGKTKNSTNVVAKGDDKIKLPLLPLRGLTIFPYMVLHFDVGREKSIKSLEQSMIMNQLIFLVSQKDEVQENPKTEDLFNIGTISRIKQILKLPGDTIRVLVEGVSRASIVKYLRTEDYFEVELKEDVQEDINDSIEMEAMMRSVLDALRGLLKQTQNSHRKRLFL